MTPMDRLEAATTRLSVIETQYAATKVTARSHDSSLLQSRAKGEPVSDERIIAYYELLAERDDLWRRVCVAGEEYERARSSAHAYIAQAMKGRLRDGGEAP